MPAGGRTAEGKARQRARNKAQGSAGSSGISMLAGSMARKEWEDIESIAQHVTDLQCVVQSGQMMANRALTATLVASKEWAPEMLAAVMDTHHLATYVRVYVVPLDAVMPDPDEED